MWATCRFDDPAGVTTAGPAAAGLITGQRQEPNHRSYIDPVGGGRRASVNPLRPTPESS